MNTNGFHFVNPSILADIGQLKAEFDSYSSYHLPYATERKKSLQQDATRHSVEVEMVGYSTGNVAARTRKRRDKRLNERSLSNALNWGMDNCPQDLSEDFIVGIAQRVEPGINQYGYRIERVRLLGSPVFPPAPERIPREMQSFLFQNSCIDNIVEKAIHSHFNIVRIHPFEEGNGRTARLVQDIILQQGGYFPVCISMNDRKKYIRLVSNAIESQKYLRERFDQDSSSPYFQMNSEIIRLLSKPSVTIKEALYCRYLALKTSAGQITPEERSFYDYIAGKVRDTLDMELKRIKCSKTLPEKRKK